MNHVARAALILVLVASGCAVSSYQTARVLPAGKSRVTVAGSSLHIDDISDDDSDGDTFECVDLLIDHGIGNNAEFSARYTNFGFEGTGNTLMVGAKFGLVPDRVAVLVPIGATWADDELGAYLVHPRLIGSFPAGNNAELVGSLGVAVVIPDEDGADTESYFGGSLGVRLSTALERWAFQPEIGVMDVEDSTVISIGAAFSATM